VPDDRIARWTGTEPSAVEVDQDGHVLVLRINRPEALNAINNQVMDELTAAVKRARKDDSVRCLVLTGAPRPDGRPCFSAGDDLKEAAAGLLPPGNPGLVLCNAIDDLLKPSIAVIDGVCTTGAVELALACDLRVVAESAQISDWHLARLGSGLGGWGASTRLARLVGVAQAKDIILTGKVIDGCEAHRIGFAQRLVPAERLWGEAMEMAGAIAGMRPEGVRMTMAHLSRVEDLSKEESLSFAIQVGRWFGSGGSTFQQSAGEVLAKADPARDAGGAPPG
jgi:enoyl-CoA hydratase/carnithine racemase